MLAQNRPRLDREVARLPTRELRLGGGGRADENAGEQERGEFRHAILRGGPMHPR